VSVGDKWLKFETGAGKNTAHKNASFYIYALIHASFLLDIHQPFIPGKFLPTHLISKQEGRYLASDKIKF
jgi:hypothetical protein